MLLEKKHPVAAGSLVIAQVHSRQQKLQGKQHKLARKRSQEGSASVSSRFPGWGRCGCVGRLGGLCLQPCATNHSLRDADSSSSGKRAVLHHTWLLCINTSVLNRSLSHSWVLRGCLTSVSTEVKLCFVRSHQKLSADTCADNHNSGYFFTTGSF